MEFLYLLSIGIPILKSQSQIIYSQQVVRIIGQIIFSFTAGSGTYKATQEVRRRISNEIMHDFYGAFQRQLKTYDTEWKKLSEARRDFRDAKNDLQTVYFDMQHHFSLREKRIDEAFGIVLPGKKYVDEAYASINASKVVLG